MPQPYKRARHSWTQLARFRQCAFRDRVESHIAQHYPGTGSEFTVFGRAVHTFHERYSEHCRATQQASDTRGAERIADHIARGLDAHQQDDFRACVDAVLAWNIVPPGSAVEARVYFDEGLAPRECDEGRYFSMMIDKLWIAKVKSFQYVRIADLKTSWKVEGDDASSSAAFDQLESYAAMLRHAAQHVARASRKGPAEAPIPHVIAAIADDIDDYRFELTVYYPRLGCELSWSPDNKALDAKVATIRHLCEVRDAAMRKPISALPVIQNAFCGSCPAVFRCPAMGNLQIKTDADIAVFREAAVDPDDKVAIRHALQAARELHSHKAMAKRLDPIVREHVAVCGPIDLGPGRGVIGYIDQPQRKISDTHGAIRAMQAAGVPAADIAAAVSLPVTKAERLIGKVEGSKKRQALRVALEEFTQTDIRQELRTRQVEGD